jgi:3',5'-cyclic AMP phosphodiesterase CpdA
MNPSLRIKTFCVSVAALALVSSASVSLAEPWSFGVMADTQWKSNLDGGNPNSVAVGIINQLNTQFIGAGVKFVVQVGDITDNGSNAALDTRAAAAQALYDAGIGYYPLRGNHESSQVAATYFQTKFQQTQGQGSYVFGASNFSSPFLQLNGLSYSFDYGGNARLVLLDQFTRTDGTNNTGGTDNNIIDQQDWIGASLAGKPADSHAFVFAHKGLITENHTDILFGADPSSNPAAQNAFIASLFNNGVRYFMGGHDHMHNRAIVKSPDGLSTVQNIIGSSNSYKFYIPLNPTNDTKYNLNLANNSSYCQPITTVRPICELRETPIAQELFSVGYYIFTVDGPRVTVDFYASPNGCNGDCDLTTTPVLTFTKRETFGYSLNGKESRVPQGQSSLPLT